MTSPTQDGPVELTQDHVKQIFGLSDNDAAQWHPLFKKYCDMKGINTILRLSAFCAQVGHESGQLRTLSENLNYSADRLIQVFPKYFNQSNVSAYARNPEAIASRTYGNRMGNGNEASKEGYKFRGRGLIQVTGKSNYQQCDRFYPCLDNPDSLTTKEGAVASAVWYWSYRGLNTHADRGDFDKTTFLINGGQNGAADRRAKYAHAIKVLTGQETVVIGEVDPTVEPKVTTSAETQITSPAFKGSFGEPSLQRRPQYPWNWVNVSRSGHVEETDDTPGAERLYKGHRAGSYWTFLPDGSATYKTVLDRSDITLGDQDVYVQGSQANVIEQQVYYRVGTDYVINLGGMFFVEGTRAQFNVPVAAFRDLLIARVGEFENLACVNVAQLTAEHALTAEKISGKGGSTLAGLSESVNFPQEGGGPVFTKPVRNTHPMGLAVGTAGGLPPAAEHPDAIMVFKEEGLVAGQPRKIVYSDGINWRNVKDDSIVVPGV